MAADSYAERNAADFQIAASVRSLDAFTDLASRLAGHPAVESARTIVPAFPGPVPPALPRTWL